MQTIKNLSIEELGELIAEVVEEKLQELLVDPDQGLPPCVPRSKSASANP